MFFSCPFQRQKGNMKEWEVKRKKEFTAHNHERKPEKSHIFTPAFKHVINVTLTFLLIY